MKTSCHDIIKAWCRNNQEIFAREKNITSAPLALKTVEKEISSEAEAAEAVSQIFEEKISSEKLFWGVPICKQQTMENWKICSGYVLDYNDLGWIFMWKHNNQVAFLDKLLFDMEKCYSFASVPTKNILLLKWKIRLLIIVVIICIALVCLYIGNYV